MAYAILLDRDYVAAYIRDAVEANGLRQVFGVLRDFTFLVWSECLVWQVLHVNLILFLDNRRRLCAAVVISLVC